MAMTLLSTQTADGDGSLSFTASAIDGFNSTYKLYIFKFYDVNPETNGTYWRFNGSIDAGSNYNATKTTTYFRARNPEAGGSEYELAYEASLDLAQSTAPQLLSKNVGSGADEACAGELFLFNPSNTTYVKHFYSTLNSYHGSDYAHNEFVSGYFNTTSDIDAVQFDTTAGDFDAVVKMYGVG